MFEIEIPQKHAVETETTSSKGNQRKWSLDGWWYKADSLGYEGLAEVVVSRILSHSNLEGITEYEPGMILYNGKRYRGCRSRNFIRESERLITLERLHRIYTGAGLAGKLAKIRDVGERVEYATAFVKKTAHLELFGAYLTKILETDAFFLNEDRHTNNIAVIYDETTMQYRLSPFFDMGLSLFADTKEAYPFSKKTEDCMREITAKPFSRDFDEQLDAANERNGDFLRIGLSVKDIEDIVREAGQEAGYEEYAIERIVTTLRMQAAKYTYMLGDN